MQEWLDGGRRKRRKKSENSNRKAVQCSRNSVNSSTIILGLLFGNTEIEECGRKRVDGEGEGNEKTSREYNKSIEQPRQISLALKSSFEFWIKWIDRTDMETERESEERRQIKRETVITSCWALETMPTIFQTKGEEEEEGMSKSWF